MARSRGGWFDLVLHLLSPALVIGLVGALVFFLAEVLYAGQYTGRLNWTLFFFVFGSVLIARIAAEYDAGRAAAYGLALGGVVFAALLSFVEYPESMPRALAGIVNLGLMAVVWFSAHRLTNDCTVVDDGRSLPPMGLLETAGLQALDPDAGRVSSAEDLAPLVDAPTPADTLPAPPGRWVIYFSLAALPLFGLGQALIPPNEPGRRSYSYWLLAVYLACGLGLLVTTRLLALRRTLRQRRLNMPGTLTRTWLLAGGGMILGVVLLALLAPRPESLHVAGWKRLGSEDLQASKRSAGGSDAGKGPGQPQGDNRKDDPADKNGQGGQGQPKGDQKGDTKSQEKSAGQGSSNVQDQQSEKKNNAEPSSLGSQPPPTPPPPRPVLPTLTMPPVLRWLVFAVVLVIVVLAVAWYVMQLWEQQERSRKPTANEEPAESTPRERRWPPFSSYRNPFLSGERRPLPELVRYTFAAMESWAAERGHPRQPEETPGEFARRLQQATELGSAVALAGLLGRVEYGSGRLPANGHEAVRAFWDESG